MTLSIIVGLGAAGVLTAFFYRTAKLDIGGAMLAALLALALVGMLIVAIVYAGVFFD